MAEIRKSFERISMSRYKDITVRESENVSNTHAQAFNESRVSSFYQQLGVIFEEESSIKDCSQLIHR